MILYNDESSALTNDILFALYSSLDFLQFSKNKERNYNYLSGLAFLIIAKNQKRNRKQLIYHFLILIKYHYMISLFSIKKYY